MRLTSMPILQKAMDRAKGDFFRSRGCYTERSKRAWIVLVRDIAVRPNGVIPQNPIITGRTEVDAPIVVLLDVATRGVEDRVYELRYTVGLECVRVAERKDLTPVW